MKNFAIILALVFSGAFAQANSTDTTASTWLCSMRFDGRAVGFKLFIGYYRYDGHGDINCVNTAGEKANLPIVVTMHSSRVSPTISLSDMRLIGAAANISLPNESPSALLGNYGTLQGSIAFVGGVGAITAVHADNKSITFDIGFQLAGGFGFNLGINKMVIALDKSRLL